MTNKELEERIGRLERNQKRLARLWEENLKIAAVYPFANMTTDLENILNEMELNKAQEAEGQTFFVIIDGKTPIVVTVKRDEYRADHMDVHSVLEEWITKQIGSSNNYKRYDYWEIERCKSYSI